MIYGVDRGLIKPTENDPTDVRYAVSFVLPSSATVKQFKLG